MLKKIITAGAATALILANAMPALAQWGPPPMPSTTNVGIVTDNNVVAVSNTGLNGQLGGTFQMVTTGATQAIAGQTSYVNSNYCIGCVPSMIKTTNFGVVADNNVVAVANTGLNIQVGSMFPMPGFQAVETGKATTQSVQWNVVNSSIPMTTETN